MSVVIHFTTDPFNSVLVLLFWLVPPLFFMIGVRVLGYNSTDGTFNMNWIMVCEVVLTALCLFCLSVFVCRFGCMKLCFVVFVIF
jgi:hypothetical protein